MVAATAGLRRFIRHPVCLPIEACHLGGGTVRAVEAFSLGVGGLAFLFHQSVEPGTHLWIRITHVRPEFETEARVAWCRELADDDQFAIEVGVQFLNSEDAFRARMVEQVCHIDEYRRRVRVLEERDLSPEEAAQEWVAKFAAAFPDPD